MACMVIIYSTPTNPAEFDKHYFDVHVPMAMKLPGIRKYDVSTGSIVALAGASRAYLIATLHFDSLEAIKAAFASDIGRACAADRRVMVPDDKDVQMFLFDNRDV